MNYHTDYMTIYGNLYVMKHILKLPDITLVAYLRHVSPNLPYSIGTQDVDNVLSVKPKTFYLTKFLHSLGFSIDNICSILGITRATYYYNEKQPMQHYYYNNVLDELINGTEGVKEIVVRHPSWEGVRLKTPLVEDIPYHLRKEETF